jgi:hypothetical protein
MENNFRSFRCFHALLMPFLNSTAIPPHQFQKKTGLRQLF